MTKKILIVDDDRDTREALAAFLDYSGFESDTVGNGREALDYLHRGNRPSLILLDLMMPVMSGSEFLFRRQGDRELAAIPVVMLTASGSARKPPEAVRLLSKPVDLGKLLPEVEEYCRAA